MSSIERHLISCLHQLDDQRRQLASALEHIQKSASHKSASCEKVDKDDDDDDDDDDQQMRLKEGDDNVDNVDNDEASKKQQIGGNKREDEEGYDNHSDNAAAAAAVGVVGIVGVVGGGASVDNVVDNNGIEIEGPTGVSLDNAVALSGAAGGVVGSGLQSVAAE